jgi:hypothetical protein
MFDRPALLLRLEGAALFVATIVVYVHLHASWLLFAVLFLAPDLFMLGYLANPRLGSAVYNLAHTVALPLALLAWAFATRHPAAGAVATIWLSHIEWDRMLGYGLKYPTFFKDTHLQHV